MKNISYLAQIFDRQSISASLQSELLAPSRYERPLKNCARDELFYFFLLKNAGTALQSSLSSSIITSAAGSGFLPPLEFWMAP